LAVKQLLEQLWRPNRSWCPRAQDLHPSPIATASAWAFSGSSVGKSVLQSVLARNVMVEPIADAVRAILVGHIGWRLRARPLSRDQFAQIRVALDAAVS
jgi:hypothetical protein